MGEKEKHPGLYRVRIKNIIRKKMKERTRPMFGHKKKVECVRETEKDSRIVPAGPILKRTEGASHLLGLVGYLECTSDLRPLTAVLNGVIHVSTFGGVCSYHPFKLVIFDIYIYTYFYIP
jgi:hypothetical protein